MPASVKGKLIAVIVVSVLPFLLNQLGVDFGTTGTIIEPMREFLERADDDERLIFRVIEGDFAGETRSGLIRRFQAEAELATSDHPSRSKRSQAIKPCGRDRR